MVILAKREHLSTSVTRDTATSATRDTAATEARDSATSVRAITEALENSAKIWAAIVVSAVQVYRDTTVMAMVSVKATAMTLMKGWDLE